MKSLYVIEGATAVGKTDFAIKKATEWHTEIISADSRQFYKELNIGVARPSEEELAAVKHHFIAHISIFDYYSISKFEQDVLNLLDDLFKKHDTVIMTGGSGLYVNAVCNGIDNLPDPDEHIRFQVNEILEKDGIEQLQMMLKVFDPVFYEQIDLQNHQRLRRAVEVCLQTGKPYSQLRTHPQKERPFEIERVMLYRPIDKIYDRINKRVDVMLEQGLLNEAKHLYPHKNLNALNTMGYKEIFEYLDGKISLEQAITDIKTHSRRYAKKQLTWLKRQCIDGVIYLHS